MATGTIILPVQSAKIGGAFVSTGAQIEGGAGQWKLLYDASQGETGIWQFRLPANYSTTPTIKLQYVMASATSGGVVFDVDIMAVSDGDAVGIGTASFDAINTGSAIVANTAGYMQELSLTLLTVDSMLAGDLVCLRVTRDVADAGDTATGDMQLLAASFEYTTS